jgi:hypothetical protein
VLQLHILKYLRAIGAYAGKTKTMGVKRGRAFCFDPYTFRGFPDISCFHKDKLYFIEVKSSTGTQSLEQKTFQTFCDKAGITYILARDLSDIEKIIS